MKRRVWFVILAMYGLAGLTTTSAQTQGFSLKSGDAVVFYGDSITAQNLYNQWVELYTITRFPGMRVHFYGSGVGGDRVSGGSGGPIDERLARDVFAHKPTVVTVMLGMNDGRYQGTTDEIESAYMKGYEHLLESIHTNAPGARITLLGPSPFDDVTRPAEFAGGYNAVMLHFADLDKGLAQKYGGDICQSESAGGGGAGESAGDGPAGGQAAAAGPGASGGPCALGDGGGAAEGMECAGAGFIGDH